MELIGQFITNFYRLLLLLVFYLKKGAFIDKQDNIGWSALMAACKNGHDKIVKELIDGGSQLEFRNEDDGFPLYFASQNGHVEIVKLLLKNRLNVDSTKKDGATAQLQQQ